MCDFYSQCVRVDGAEAHIQSNSHSGAVAEFKWSENDQISEFRDAPRFVECEWNGEGEFPGVDAITRGNTNATQRKVIEAR